VSADYERYAKPARDCYILSSSRQGTWLILIDH
jgi:hypothetical protein